MEYIINQTYLLTKLVNSYIISLTIMVNEYFERSDVFEYKR